MMSRLESEINKEELKSYLQKSLAEICTAKEKDNCSNASNLKVLLPNRSYSISVEI